MNGVVTRPDTGPGRGTIVALVLVLAALLTATAVPGAAVVDEANYLINVVALRGGALYPPGTDGLVASPGLLWFDPIALRTPTPSPPMSSAPPLWGFLALPFASLGWYGLVLLNALALSVSAALVWWHARRWTGERDAALLALAAFTLGNFVLEYARGIWPHGLSIGLSFGAFSLTLRALGTPGRTWSRAIGISAFGAGLLAALATGVRFQNTITIVAVLASLLVFARARVRTVAAAVAGVLPILALLSLLQHERLGSWNPISKGGGYLKVPAATQETPLYAPLEALYCLVVDNSIYPDNDILKQHGPFIRKQPETGAIVTASGVVRKAWLQSSPWVGLALLGLLGAFAGGLRSLGVEWSTRARRDAEATPGSDSDGGVRERAVSASFVFGTLLVFGLAGIHRTDGFSFNPRYLLDLTPHAALALGVALAGRRMSPGLLGLGFALGVLAVLGVGQLETIAQQRALLYLPLVLAVVLVLVRGVAARVGAGAAPLASLAVAACLGWAAGVHGLHDVAAEQRIRSISARWVERLEPLLTQVVGDAPAALFGFSNLTANLTPLVLERDLVVVNPGYDSGRTMVAVAGGLLAKQRRSFVIVNHMPAPYIERFEQTFDTRRIKLDVEDPVELMELVRARVPLPP